MPFEIPDHLLTSIREGQVVLFLGCGASLGAKNEAGKSMPNARKLGELISERFLGGNYKDSPLSQIGEYAINESDLITVQEFIRETMAPFLPSPAHLILPKFNWWGIATSNYDRLVEMAYEKSPGVQTPKAVIENGDRIEELMRDPKSVMLLKLHGCISRTANPQCPLILSTDQYITHLDGRSRLFKRFEEWGTEKTVLFVGHSLQDSDIRTIILRLSSLGQARHRYYIVTPETTDIATRFWEQKRVATIAATFDQFLNSLEAAVPEGVRKLTALRSTDELLVRERFVVKDPSLSQRFLNYFINDVEYVKAVSSVVDLVPKDFYRGINPAWTAIEKKLDAPRWLSNAIIQDHFLLDSREVKEAPKFIVIKAHAGAGKSVVLRRIAWDAAKEFDCLCIYQKPHGLLNSAALQELIGLTNERVFLFIDDLGDRVKELTSMFDSIGAAGRRLTVVGAERTNEWNISCEPLMPLVTNTYDLKYLTEKEIESLLGLLETHRSLGVLEHFTPEQRKVAFQERAGRQILVALHEATLGKTFEEIIEDEFRHIAPIEAQQIYLTISVLNRYNSPVRAGIISRIHGVPFEQFKARLFAPLEQVVQTQFNAIVRDYEYQARHPEIAEILCERVLVDQDSKYDLYIKILRALDVDYSSDRAQYRELVKARNLMQTFNNHELIKGIYEAASSEVKEDPFLYHQMAIYELNRADGNLEQCKQLLDKAELISKHDKTIMHSKAEYYLRMAELARNEIEHETFLRQATSIASGLTKTYSEKAYSFHTIVKAGLMRLRRELGSDTVNAPVLENTLREIEKTLQEGYQSHPGDPYLKSSESDLAKLLNDSERAIKALHVAFEANPRASFLALRLSEQYLASNNAPEAGSILQKAIDANPGEKKLQFAYAKYLMAYDTPNDELLLHHLKHSFNDGDRNYDAQLLYGRQLFIVRRFDDSKKIFDHLGSVYVAYNVRHTLRYPLPTLFRGEVAKIEATYCFIAREGINDRIYTYKDNVADDVWDKLTQATRVTFRIAFSFKGANAFDVALEGDSPQVDETSQQPTSK